MNKIFLIIIIGIAFNIKQYRDYEELNSKYKLYMDLYNTSTEDARRDCSQLLEIQRDFARSAACADTIEFLCADNTDKPKSCFEELKYACTKI